MSVPDFTTLYRFLQRLDDQTINRAVRETVRRLRGRCGKGGSGCALPWTPLVWRKAR
ncbi:MAG TPA: hypothetical protein VJY15_23585 [Candidatus Acidoferrum sp.]|nr:hypothetical protein [Candidatus Acidoferrum sp.]